MKITPDERRAIEDVKKAIRALPKSIWMETDDVGGEVVFWRHIGHGESIEATAPLRLRRVVASPS